MGLANTTHGIWRVGVHQTIGLEDKGPIRAGKGRVKRWDRSENSQMQTMGPSLSHFRCIFLIWRALGNSLGSANLLSTLIFLNSFRKLSHRAKVESKAGAFHARLWTGSRDHVRRSDEPDGCSVFLLSRGTMAIRRAMGAERNLARHRMCRARPVIFFAVVLDCLHCLELRAGRDSHLRARADLVFFGIAYGYFGGVCLRQIRALSGVPDFTVGVTSDCSRAAI